MCTIMCTVLSVQFATALSSLSHSSIQLTEGVHTILDGEIIGSTSEGVRVELGVLHKDPQPCVKREFPWEATLGFYSTFLFVPARNSGTNAPQWRWYYTCADDDLFTTSPGLCVAVSYDAAGACGTWTKPLLPYFPWTNTSTQGNASEQTTCTHIPPTAFYFDTVCTFSILCSHYFD